MTENKHLAIVDALERLGELFPGSDLTAKTFLAWATELADHDPADVERVVRQLGRTWVAEFGKKAPCLAEVMALLPGNLLTNDEKDNWDALVAAVLTGEMCQMNPHLVEAIGTAGLRWIRDALEAGQAAAARTKVVRSWRNTGLLEMAHERLMLDVGNPSENLDRLQSLARATEALAPIARTVREAL